jgi:hypothetical protein
MTQAFEQHLKRRTIADLNWHKFFIEWKEQESSIIELMAHLKPLYPPNYEFTDRELRAWRKMMKSVGCTNITPYKKEESKVSFFKNRSIMWIFTNNNLLFIIARILDSCCEFQ